MSIPGTHDSCARTNHNFDADKCQDWSITEQLNNGIRFLDLRLNYNNESGRDSNGFTGYDIYHGGFQYATFKPSWYGTVDPTRSDTANVYAELVNWIDAHATEFVLVYIQNTGGTNSDEYTEEFWKIITSTGPGTQEDAPSRWYLSDERSELRYDKIKGKLVLLRSHPAWRWERTGHPTENYGLRFRGYAESGFTKDGYFNTQNFWEKVGDEKVLHIQTLYKQLELRDPGDELTYMNWISRGYDPGSMTTPLNYADAYNPLLSKLIDAMANGSARMDPTLPHPQNLGITILDFPTVELIEKIIDYELK